MNTEKGKQLLELCDGLYLEERDNCEAVNGNGQLKGPAKNPLSMNCFGMYTDEKESSRQWTVQYTEKQIMHT